MQPAYDPQTQTWFAGSFEAKSLKELAMKIQPQSIENYYPNGVPLALIKEHMQAQIKLLGHGEVQPKCGIPVMTQNEDAGVVSEWKGSLPPARIAQPASPFTTSNYREIAEKRGMRGPGSVAAIVNAHNNKVRGALA